MSAIYHTEPPTQGKVLIKTNFGDIDVELWAKEAPLACRNFIQLSLEGYYDNTIIHRIIKGFMVQMGDPTGTGTGGKSIWGRPFKDEVHGRLKFNHRGQVAMANENAPNTNQSQFFITLDACDWLDRKHTIFGKVTGNTIFNVLRAGEVEVGGEGGDRPVEELKVLGIEVLWNPFDDIVPRDLSEKKAAPTSTTDSKSKNIKAVRDTKLLSFGDDEEDGDEGGFTVQMKSSHEAKGKGKKKSKEASDAGTTKGASDKGGDGDGSAGSARLEALSRYGATSSGAGEGSASSGAAGGARKGSRWGGYADSAGTAAQQNDNGAEDREEEDGQDDEGEGANAEADFDRQMRSELLRQRQSEQTKNMPARAAPSASAAADADNDVILDHSSMQNAATDAQRSGALQTSNEVYRKLKEDLLRSRRAVNVLMGADAAKYQEESAFKELVSPLEQRRRKFLKRRNEHGDRGGETMEKLRKFTDTIRSAKSGSAKQTSSSSADGDGDGDGDGADAEAEGAENYHGQVLEEDERNVDPEREKRELQTWFVGKLKCKKHIDDKYRNGNSAPSGSDGRSMDDYLVVDARAERMARNRE